MDAIIFMAISQQLASFGISDKGYVRKDNEDAFAIHEAYGLFAVADGLGGVPHGKVASQLALEVLAELIKKYPLSVPLPLENIVKTINTIVYNRGLQLSPQWGIATTLTLAQVHQGHLYIAHVGDSGLAHALAPAKPWAVLTKDHTMAQDWLDQMPGQAKNASASAIPSHFYHTLTRCIGQSPSVRPDCYESLPCHAGQRLLLYTDGLTKMITWDDVQQLSVRCATPEAFATQLVQLSNDRGGIDNTTVVAVFHP
jgi:protein phosphatase